MAIDIQTFQNTVMGYYKIHGRHDLPWRVERTPFNAFLSEIMLQQTQVSRVIEKFNQFKARYCSFEDIAISSQSEILTLWQGLGYNRRALYLHKATQIIASQHNGILPQNPEDLVTLPGIGSATAASMVVYAYNKPIPYIETNIRAVYIHHFFKDQQGVSDTELMPIIAKTLDQQDPYNWYSALMDYGTNLKSVHRNPSRRSRHHTKQSTFKGSKRQIRGRVVRIISEMGQINKRKLINYLNDDRSDDVIGDLIKESMLVERNASLHLKG